MRRYKKKSNKFNLFFLSKDDSDYEMDEDGAEKKKRVRKITTKAANEIRFGKINVIKYFNKEVISGEDAAFPNYNNIQIKPLKINKRGNNISYKICNVCFGFANYTCPRCGDRYCTKECFKTHKEVKCVKYLEL
jgi:zinc finger HIT domain-containing protein 1